MKTISASEAKILLKPYLEQFQNTDRQKKIDGFVDPLTLYDLRGKEGDIDLEDGDVHVKDLHLKAGSHNLFIKGNLTVDGILKLDFNAGHLVVFGNLYAKHIITTSEIVVLGDLNVSGVLYGNTTNYFTHVFGKSTVNCLVAAKEHLFCFFGGFKASTIIDVYGRTPNLEKRNYDKTTMKDVLLDGVIEKTDILFNPDSVYEFIKKHDTLLK